MKKIVKEFCVSFFSFFLVFFPIKLKTLSLKNKLPLRFYQGFKKNYVHVTKWVALKIYIITNSICKSFTVNQNAKVQLKGKKQFSNLLE